MIEAKKVLWLVIVFAVMYGVSLALFAWGSSWNVTGNTSNIIVCTQDTLMNLPTGTKIIMPNDTITNEK